MASGQQTGSDHDDDDDDHYYGDGYDGHEGFNDTDDGGDGDYDDDDGNDCDEDCDDGDDAHAILLGTEVASNAWLEDESYMTVVPAVLGLGAGDDSDDEESEQYFSISYLSFFASQVI